MANNQRRLPATAEQLHKQGLLNLDVPIRRVVELAGKAPAPEYRTLEVILNTLHDQGVVNLDVPIKKAVDSVDLKDLQTMRATLFATSSYCLIVQTPKKDE